MQMSLEDIFIEIALNQD